MSLKCSWSGCKPEKIKEFDPQGHYILGRCPRCGMEKIHFIREDVTYNNTPGAMRLVRKCMKSPEFVSEAIRYRKFREINAMKDEFKRSIHLDSFYNEYSLENGSAVPDPFVLFSVNRWFGSAPVQVQKKKSVKRKRQKPESTEKPHQAKENPPAIRYSVKNDPAGLHPDSDKKTTRRSSVQRLRELSLTELNKLLEDYVQKEKYEKAALVKKEIDRRNQLLQ